MSKNQQNENYSPTPPVKFDQNPLHAKTVNNEGPQGVSRDTNIENKDYEKNLDLNIKGDRQNISKNEPKK